jgi:hypothetical protein
MKIEFCNSPHEFVFIKRNDIAVLEISVEFNRNSKTLEDCLFVAGAELVRIYNHLNILKLLDSIIFFVRTPSCYMPNVIDRRKGLWGHSELDWVPAECEKSDSIVRSDKNGKYYCGAAKLNTTNITNITNIFEALNHSRNSASSVLLFSSNIDAISMSQDQNFDMIFGNEYNSIDWEKTIAFFCTDNNIIAKVHGQFDDHELFVDLFMSDKLRHILESW